MRRISVLTMCLLLCLMTVTGCGQKSVQETASVPTEAPVVQTSPTSVETALAETEPRLDVVVVSTVFGDICYQEQWSEHMRVDMKASDGLLTVNFLAEFNGLKYPLFDVLIGVNEEEAVTHMTGPDGNVRGVGVNFMELDEYPELAEDQQNQLYAMQEDINFIIESIQ